MKKISIFNYISFAIFATVFCIHSTHACNVPVFRYALERWERSPYTLVIVSNGKLSDDHKKLVQQLQAKTFFDTGTINLEIQPFNISDPSGKKLLLQSFPVLEKDLKMLDKPRAFLFYPIEYRLPIPLIKRSFDQQFCDLITTQHYCDRLMAELLRGESIVWLFIESGNKKKDDPIYEMIKKTLKSIEKEASLPKGVIQADGTLTGDAPDAYSDPSNFLQSDIPLKTSFNPVRMPKSVKAEVLRETILNLDVRLKDLKDEPLLIPIFGKGRFLFPVFGKDLCQAELQAMTEYICGACSCQVKAQNPGIDLLTTIDWQAYLSGNEVIQDKDLPPLSGTADLTEETSKPVKQIEKLPKTDQSEEVSNLFIKTIIAAVVIGTILITLISITVIKKK